MRLYKEGRKEYAIANFRKILGIAALLLIGLVPLVACGPAALPDDVSVDLVPLDPQPTRDPNATEQPTSTPYPTDYVKPTDLPTTTPFPTLPPNPTSPPRGAGTGDPTISQKLVQFITDERNTFDSVVRVKVLSHRTHVVPLNVTWPDPADPPYLSPELEYRTYTRTKLKTISTVQGPSLPATFELVAMSIWPNIALDLNKEYILFVRQQVGAVGDFDGHPSKVEYNAKQLKAFGGKASHLMGQQVWIIDGTVARRVPLDHHQSEIAGDSLAAAKLGGESMTVTQLTRLITSTITAIDNAE